MSRDRADLVAAWATGTGIGLMALMVAWLIGNRLAGLVWDPPLGPVVAFVTAIVVGAITGMISGRRLSRRATSGVRGQTQHLLGSPPGRQPNP
jgi:hypothetical protein